LSYFVLTSSGTTCSDLTLIEDGNSDTVDGLVNFPKFEMLAKAMKGFLQYNTKHNEIGMRSETSLCCRFQLS
jgi:hypothetical protein